MRPPPHSDPSPAQEIRHGWMRDAALAGCLKPSSKWRGHHHQVGSDAAPGMGTTMGGRPAMRAEAHGQLAQRRVTWSGPCCPISSPSLSHKGMHAVLLSQARCLPRLTQSSAGIPRCLGSPLRPLLHRPTAPAMSAAAAAAGGSSASLQEPSIIDAVLCDHRNVTAMLGLCIEVGGQPARLVAGRKEAHRGSFSKASVSPPAHRLLLDMGVH